MLRTMKAGDTPLIIKWRNTENVRRRFIYREPFTPEGHENWIRTMVDTGRAVQFMICEKDGGRPVGSVYFRDIDREKGEAEYGVFIGEDDAQGKGFGTEAAALAVSCAFDGMGMKRLFLRVFTDNMAAVTSYEKTGFQINEIKRAVECSDGERKDMYFMSLSREDYMDGRKE